MSQFRNRAEQVHAYCYQGANAPAIQINEFAAHWLIDPGEIWSTANEFDRITRLTLAAHRLRILAFIRPQDDKIKVSLEPRGCVPTSPNDHHPGLSDLVARAYQFGNRKSDSDLLIEAREIIRALLFTEIPESESNPIHDKATTFLREVRDR